MINYENLKLVFRWCHRLGMMLFNELFNRLEVILALEDDRVLSTLVIEPESGHLFNVFCCVKLIVGDLNFGNDNSRGVIILFTNFVIDWLNLLAGDVPEVQEQTLIREGQWANLEEESYQ